MIFLTEMESDQNSSYTFNYDKSVGNIREAYREKKKTMKRLETEIFLYFLLALTSYKTQHLYRYL